MFFIFLKHFYHYINFLLTFGEKTAMIPLWGGGSHDTSGGKTVMIHLVEKSHNTSGGKMS